MGEEVYLLLEATPLWEAYRVERWDGEDYRFKCFCLRKNGQEQIHDDIVSLGRAIYFPY